jgi:hypothetical protein
VKYIAEPGLDIRLALGKVRDEVLATTGNQQEPFVYGPLEGTNNFLVPAPSKARTLDGQDAEHAAASDYELAERVGSRQAWQDFLAAHSSGYYADLARVHLARLPPIETKLPPIETAKPTIAAPEAPNNPAAPLDGQDADHIAASDYEKAERLGSRQAWQVFLAAHNSGYYASLARIHLARLQPIAARPAPIETKLPPVEATKPTMAAPETPNKAGTPSASRPLPSAQKPAAVITSMAPERACKSDAAKLAALRLNPSPDQVAKFSSALRCEDLRPQVERFVESLGIENPAEQKSRTLEAPPQGESSDREEICKRESEELSRLRANPIRENAVRFARDLKCEDLKSQVTRLLESISD